MAKESTLDGGIMSGRDYMRSILADKTGLLLVGILFVGLFLRLYGQNWDQGGLFHPDERSIYMRISSLRKKLLRYLPEIQLIKNRRAKGFYLAHPVIKL